MDRVIDRDGIAHFVTGQYLCTESVVPERLSIGSHTGFSIRSPVFSNEQISASQTESCGWLIRSSVGKARDSDDVCRTGWRFCDKDAPTCVTSAAATGVD